MWQKSNFDVQNRPESSGRFFGGLVTAGYLVTLGIFHADQMTNNKTIDPKEILASAKNILLIDWPNKDVLKTLLNAGFTVFSYSPGRYTRAEILRRDDHNESDLVFHELPGIPGLIDIVNIYRPEQEHGDIISKHVLPLNAKVVWLHPPVVSEKTRSRVHEHGLIFVEGVSISEAAQR